MKPEYTNEEIAEAAGWVFVEKQGNPDYPGSISIWKFGNYKTTLPYFQSDLEECFKSEIPYALSAREYYQIMGDAWQDKWEPEKIAEALCRAFMKNQPKG